MKKIVVFAILLVSAVLAESGKFSALGYYEFTYTFDEDVDISNEFEFHRVYLTYQKKMSDKLSYKFQSDVGRKSDDGRLEVYLKNAKVDWKTDYGKIVLGLQGTNLFKVQESTWGYRAVEKSVMDKKKFGSSAVMGVGYFNKLENLNYSVLLSNGAGYKKPEYDSNKKILARIYHGQAKLNSKDGTNFGIAASFEPYELDDDDTGSMLVAGVFGGYAKGPLRVGVEFDVENDSEADDNIALISAYANYQINGSIDVFGRFDNTNYGEESNNYVIAGLAMSPEKGLKIMPNIRYSKDNDVDASVKYNLNFEFNIK